MNRPATDEIGILAIDDDGDMRELLKRTLARAGYNNVIAAGSARTAVDFLKNAPGEIHLILLDLDMPDMNGIAFLKKLRNDAEKRIAAIPVIVVTAHGTREVEQGLEPFDIQGFVPKPPDPEKLQSAIRHALGGQSGSERSAPIA